MSFTDPYAILGIQRGASDSEVKKAYRKALLTHHPDKILHARTTITIDEINTAYQRIKQTDETSHASHTNEVVNFNEIVDLSDLEASELPDGSMQWIRNCRCGGDGYILFEQDLELNGDADEIAVQCTGCSIFILVQYSVE